MTDTSSYQPRPLPVTIVPGRHVFDVSDCPSGTVAGITQAYCLYRLADTETENETLCVAAWRDIALGNICPAGLLLPADVTENDRRNASATALRELLQLKQFGQLTPAQKAALDELMASLLG